MIIVAYILVGVFALAAAAWGYWYLESAFAGLASAVAAVLLSALVFWPVSLGYANPRDMTCHVEDKDRTARSKGGSDMRIYTRECGVLKVQDLFWAGRFDSADVFGAIEPGHTYRFHVTGVRIEFFSVFPNVRSVERVS